MLEIVIQLKDNKCKINKIFLILHFFKKQRWGENVYREKIQVSNFTKIIQEEIDTNHKSLAKNVRKKINYQFLEPLNVILI